MQPVRHALRQVFCVVHSRNQCHAPPHQALQKSLHLRALLGIETRERLIETDHIDDPLNAARAVQGHRKRGELIARGGLERTGDVLLGISQPAVSKHLRILRDAGLVGVRADAQRRLYRLQSEPLRQIDDWLEPYRAAWSGHLAALERHLDEMPT